MLEMITGINENYEKEAVRKGAEMIYRIEHQTITPEELDTFLKSDELVDITKNRHVLSPRYELPLYEGSEYEFLSIIARTLHTEFDPAYLPFVVQDLLKDAYYGMEEKEND